MTGKLDQILVLDPPYDLKFKGPFLDVVTAQLRLKNPSDRTVCFKVKTTAPRRYCVRPNSGVLDPGASIAVSVMLQPFDYDPNEKSKHKFMVQSIAYSPNAYPDAEAVWKDAKPDDLMDSKLRCVFEMPSDNDRQEVTGNRMDGWMDAAHLFNSDSCSASRPGGAPLDQSETRRLVDECKRLQAEVGKLSEENRQLKDDGVRMRRGHRSDDMLPSSAMSRDHAPSSLPSLLVVIAAIFIGLFLGKLVL